MRAESGGSTSTVVWLQMSSSGSRPTVQNNDDAVQLVTSHFTPPTITAFDLQPPRLYANPDPTISSVCRPSLPDTWVEKPCNCGTINKTYDRSVSACTVPNAYVRHRNCARQHKWRGAKLASNPSNRESGDDSKGYRGASKLREGRCTPPHFSHARIIIIIKPVG